MHQMQARLILLESKPSQYPSDQGFLASFRSVKRFTGQLISKVPLYLYPLRKPTYTVLQIARIVSCLRTGVLVGLLKVVPHLSSTRVLNPNLNDGTRKNSPWARICKTTRTFWMSSDDKMPGGEIWPPWTSLICLTMRQIRPRIWR